MTFALVGITSANNLDAQVCLRIGKIPLFIEKIILIKNGKKGTLDYQISSAYQINIQFEMTFRDKLKLTNNKKKWSQCQDSLEARLRTLNSRVHGSNLIAGNI